MPARQHENEKAVKVPSGEREDLETLLFPTDKGHLSLNYNKGSLSMKEKT